VVVTISADNLPHDIRLIAAVSRLIDIHQSRREAGGTYVPDVPERAGFNLHLALSAIECLHEIEMDRGIGFCPINELVARMRKRAPQVTDADIEYCVSNLGQAREIHYGMPGQDGEITYARTWDTTPLIDVEEGFSQIHLTENARLLLRVSSLRESWLYSDLDADRLIKAIERGQFQDVPVFCRAMTLDLAAKSKQLSGVLERPSLAELRSLLIAEGSSIAASLSTAAVTISHAIELVFNEHIQASFSVWAGRTEAKFYLGNLQADLELVLQNVESLSRRFLRFIEMAQRVRNEGNAAIHFLHIANSLAEQGSEDSIRRTEALLHGLMPWGLSTAIFHPSMMVGAADLREQIAQEPERVHGFTVDPTIAGNSSRLMDFLMRNRDLVIQRLQRGPASFSEMMSLTGLVLGEGETPLDFFGVYAAPGMLTSENQKIVVGLTDLTTQFVHADREVTGSDPVMFLEETP